MKKDITKFDWWGFVKGVSTLTVVVVLCIKIYQTPIDLQVDFPTLLSLLLGFFSVGLAALFYFKATETSNSFYDNTYKFTNQISELLAKIESGFGERLRHLDEGYASVREYIQNPKSRHESDIETTKSKIKEEQKEIEKVITERNKIIQDLISKSQLQEEEKQNITKVLEEKEAELNDAQNEISKMRKRLFADQIVNRKLTKNVNQHVSENALTYTQQFVIPQLGDKELLESDFSDIKRKFEEISDTLPFEYIEDLEDADLYDSNGLTRKGVRFLLQLVKATYI